MTSIYLEVINMLDEAVVQIGHVTNEAIDANVFDQMPHLETMHITREKLKSLRDALIMVAHVSLTEVRAEKAGFPVDMKGNA